MRIKNWATFQHFKDRRPPWIKLHRELMEQRDINMISDRAFRVLVNLWLLASEDKTLSGILPPIEDIAFRLRMKESEINKALQELSPWVEQDDINTISERYQSNIPETEAYKEETEIDIMSEFENIWKDYPRRDGKKDAHRHFKATVKTQNDLSDIKQALCNYKKSVATTERRFIKNGSTWFNNWRDWVDNEEPAQKQNAMQEFDLSELGIEK